MENIVQTPIIKVDCIDKDTLSDIKTALITTKNNLEDFAKNTKDKETKDSYRNKAMRMHIILDEIKKIRPCETNLEH